MNIKLLKEKITEDDFDEFKKYLQSYSLKLSHEDFEKQIILLLKFSIINNKIVYFNEILNNYLSPEVFWKTNGFLFKNPSKLFIQTMDKFFRRDEKETERKNDYISNLVCDFIESDNLEMVDWLVGKGASLESIPEIDFSILAYCVEHNAVKCLDYFLAKGLDVKETDDLAIFACLKFCKYEYLNLIVSYYPELRLSEEIQCNFFLYNDVTTKQLNKMHQIVEPILHNNIFLQNSLNSQLIKHSMYKKLEINFKKGYSPFGDEINVLMDEALRLKKIV